MAQNILPGSIGAKEINKDQVVVPFDWQYNTQKTQRILSMKNGYIFGVVDFNGIITPEITIPGTATELSLPEDVEVGGDLTVTGDADCQGSSNVDVALTVAGLNTRGEGIIESGSNANGEYEIFGNGRIHMTGWGFVTWVSGAGYIDKTITLPYEVSDANSLRLTAICVGEKTTNPASITDTTAVTSTGVAGRVLSTTQIVLRVTFYATIADTRRRLFSWDVWGTV